MSFEGNADGISDKGAIFCVLQDTGSPMKSIRSVASFFWSTLSSLLKHIIAFGVLSGNSLAALSEIV